MITITLPDNPPTPVVPEPDTNTTTWVYANTPTHVYPFPDITPPDNVPANPPNYFDPFPDPTPPNTPVSLVTDTPPPTTSNNTLVSDFHGVKW